MPITRRKRINITGRDKLQLANPDKSDNAVLQHLHNSAPGTLLIHNHMLSGTAHLYAYGLYACDACGHINPIERHECRKCSEPKFINLKNS